MRMRKNIIDNYRYLCELPDRVTDEAIWETYEAMRGFDEFEVVAAMRELLYPS